MKTTIHEPILVTGAAGQLGAVGRTLIGMLLDHGLAVRAMVPRENDRGRMDLPGTFSFWPGSVIHFRMQQTEMKEHRI